MGTAVEDELIRRNPCRIKGGSTERTPERQPATLDQVFAIADEITPRYKALVLVAAFATPQARARGMTAEVEHPVLGVLRQVGVPFRLAATPASIRSAPPLLGEHGDEILAELGYEAADVRTLHDMGVV